MARRYWASTLLFLLLLLGGCGPGSDENGGAGDTTQANDAGQALARNPANFKITIDSPLSGEVVPAPPVRVLARVSNNFPIESVTVNGIELDVSQQVFTPGDGNLVEDEYSLEIDINVSRTDIAGDIAGLNTNVGSFDPGSNRLVVGATDDRANRIFESRFFALGPVTAVELDPAVALMSVAGGNPGSGSNSNAALNASLPGENEIENAVVLGLARADINRALNNLCREISPTIGDALRNQLKVCSNYDQVEYVGTDESKKKADYEGKKCSADSECCNTKICVAGIYEGQDCSSNADCPGGACRSNCDDVAGCELRRVEESFSPVSILNLDNPTVCDPTFTFGVNLENMAVDALRCEVIAENGLLTLSVKPQIRALELTARGECGICVDIGNNTLNGIVGAVNLEVAVDFPAIRFTLGDWHNDRPIDPDDPAIDRFLTDSLSNPLLDKLILGESVIKDFVVNPFSSQINAFVESEVKKEEFEEALLKALDPSRTITEEIRVFAAEKLVGIKDTRIRRRECQNGNNDGTVCDGDSACTGGGSCEFKLDPEQVDLVQNEFALDSFVTTPSGLTVAVKGKFSPALFDAEVEVTPGGLSTPADAPRIGQPGAENSFVAVADDTFNQLFATVTALGEFKQSCFAPTDPDSPKTVGDFLGDCNSNPSAAGAGFCVGVQGGNCESLANPADQGVCHSIRGDNCATIPVGGLPNSLIERQACEGAPRNIAADMPLLYCSRADVPPSLWIRDNIDAAGLPIATPDRVESHVRINDLLVAVVIDREGDQASDALPDIPDCADSSANQNSDCNLLARCLDLNVPTNVALLADGEQSAFTLDLLEVQQLQRPAGAVCSGGASFPGGSQSGIDARFANLVDKALEQVNRQMPDLDAIEIPLSLSSARLIALKTSEPNIGFEDYAGLSFTPEASFCGDGVCDPDETCGYSEPGACSSDCGLCATGEVCGSGEDCLEDRCIANICQTLVSTPISDFSCDGDCLIGGDCTGGVCNFGLCTAPNSLAALSPCTTGAACQNGSCSRGLCQQICGDGFCDGTEVPGKNDAGLSCITDCGKIPNDSPLPCNDDLSCQSNVCNIVTCVAANSVPPGEICSTDAACSTGLCNAGICTFPQDNGSACVRDAGCQSGLCNGVVCVEPGALQVGVVCFDDRACRSGVCNGVCLARCGDGFCDGTEKCGGNDSTGLQCRTDCGQCANGQLCGDDNMCASGLCNAGICTSPQPNGNACVRDEGCISDLCNAGFCTSPQPDGNVCLRDKGCISGNCQLGFCRPPCRASGSSCVTDSSCCSNSCSGLFSRTCD